MPRVGAGSDGQSLRGVGSPTGIVKLSSAAPCVGAGSDGQSLRGVGSPTGTMADTGVSSHTSAVHSLA